MDGLSILFAVLTALFLVVVIGMNILSTTSLTEDKQVTFDVQESFQDKPASGSILEPIIRAVLDPMALYTSPDGNPISDGQDLCDIFAEVRKTIADNIKGDPSTPGLSDSEVMKKVEAEIASKMPLPPLPCPLLKYPMSGASDTEWYKWLQTVPTDFGARVVFMVAYADTTITAVVQQMKDALGGIGGTKTEGFANTAICTPQLAEKKRADEESKAAASCTLPESASPEQLEAGVRNMLKVITSEKKRLLDKWSKDPKAGASLGKNLSAQIANAKKGTAYLNEKKKKAQDGTLADDLNIPPEAPAPPGNYGL